MSERFGGVETGGTWCVCALGTGPGDLDDLEQFPTTTPGETLERIVAFFAGRSRPRALGIGAFGPLDLDPSSPTWGWVTTTPKAGWQHTPLATVLRDRLGVPVAIDTDTATAGLAEYRWGAGREVTNLCYLTVGTGIGGGLVLDGRPLRGLVHPEVGHVRIPRDAQDDFAGVCPSHGDCWEGLASGPAVADRWQADPKSLAADHPAWPLEARYLALGVFSIVCVASPRRVIVGGGVMEHPQLLPRVRQEVSALNAGYLDSPLLGERIDEYLVAPALGDQAGVLGAIALAARSV